MPASQAIPPGDLDWDELLRLARPHGMEPLIFRRLLSTGHDYVPDEVWGRIAAIQQENVERTLAATGELASILRALAGEGIEAISYKGPVLALQLYGDVAARRFADLDVMVRPSQLRAARGVLVRRGYVAGLELPGWKFQEFVRIQKEIAFVHEGTHQEVDLQWVLTERSFGLRWNMRGMWDRAAHIEVAGSSVQTFAPNDLALILCVHGTTHLWERLAWVADLGALVASGEVAWASVLLEAGRLGAERMVVVSLALAHRITGCGIPEPAAMVMTGKILRLAGDLYDRVLSAEGGWAQHAERPFHPVLARLRDRPLDQVRYVAGLAFTPTMGDWEAVSLPHPLRSLYYLIRPIRLAARYAFRPPHGHREKPGPMKRG